MASGKAVIVLAMWLAVLLTGSGRLPASGNESPCDSISSWMKTQVGDSIPPVVALTIDDTLLDTRDAAHRRYLLLNFLATWCKPCKEELPGLIRFGLAHTDSLQVVLIGLSGKDAADFRKLRAAFAVPFPIVWDRYGSLSELLGFTTTAMRLPVSMLMDPAGRLRWRKVGAVEDCEAEIGTAMRR